MTSPGSRRLIATGLFKLKLANARITAVLADVWVYCISALAQALRSSISIWSAARSD